ncbi:hypothetical protein Q9290_09165 [Oceanimonas sp. CHS3-5]|uniref:hypothetical protein n=1 Tax=Oceanimonas sp. CHS3-5 TaxID=3068186 RepID=UPI00273DCB45|nr:hypothetical protein [Oceanimonas sp. CHS3-5]MDP5292457.1 hypothetical protein [Oceanimonas sp. CHS3-5]
MRRSAFVSLFFLSNVAFADVESCLDDKISAHREVVGEEAPISYGMLSEWEAECEGGSSSSKSNITSSSINVSSSLEPNRYGGQSHYLLIQGREDLVTINGVRVNRGNCPIYDIRNVGDTKRIFPMKLGFGQTGKVLIRHGCDILEAEINVDGVVLSYRWN